MLPETVWLDRIRVVLVSPSHAGNVGACARALKTMGLSQLWLVSPRKSDVHKEAEAVTLSSGATDVLAAARVVDTLPEALAGCGWSIATSSRERDLGPPLLDAPQAVTGLVGRLSMLPPQAEVAIIFGCERTGLSNDELLRADVHAMIPANPAYASLNLSQAVQLLCWEVRKAVLGLTAAQGPCDASVSGSVGNSTGVVATQLASAGASTGVPFADGPAVERLFEHFLQAMEAVDFLNPDKPKRLIPRMRRLLQKSQLEREEVDMLHGFLADVLRISQGRWYRAEWEALAPAVDKAMRKYALAKPLVCRDIGKDAGVGGE